MIATAGTAVIVGVLFAQPRTDSTPSRSAVSTNGPTYSAARVPSNSAKPASPTIQAYTDGVTIAYPTQPSNGGFSSEGGPVDSRDNRYGPNSSMGPLTAQFQGAPGLPQFPSALSGQPGTYTAPQSPPANTYYPTYNPYPSAMRPATPEEMKMGQLVAELRGLPTEHHLRKQKENELRSLIAAQFETRHQQQSDQVEKLSTDVKRMQDILQRRDHQRDEIIERRLSDLTGQKDPLQWDYQPWEPPANPGYGVVPSNKVPRPYAQTVPGQQLDSLQFKSNFPQQAGSNQNEDDPVSNQLSTLPTPSEERPVDESSNTERFRYLRKLDEHGKVTYVPVAVNASESTTTVESSSEPTASQSTPEALWNAMRRLKSLKEEFAGVESTNYATADVRAQILAKLEPKVSAATEDWGFTFQQLEHQLSLQELAWEDARATEELAKSESEDATQAHQKGALTVAEARRVQVELQHATNSAQRAKLELDRLRDLHRRACEFQKQLNVAKAPDAPLPETDSAPEIAPKPVAPVEKVEGVEPPLSTRT